VKRGEARLGEKAVSIVPPDPIGELGSGWEKMAAEKRAGTVVPVRVVRREGQKS
jgi:(E)-4-hydroxy-3-methylbut-2-enyl-diphosphate synthase